MKASSPTESTTRRRALDSVHLATRIGGPEWANCQPKSPDHGQIAPSDMRAPRVAFPGDSGMRPNRSEA